MDDQQLVELKFVPGIITEISPWSTIDGKPFWTAGDKVRFVFGLPEQIGGWESTTTAQYRRKFYGSPSYIQPTMNLRGYKKALVGTENGLFGTNLAQFADITPTFYETYATNVLQTFAGQTKIRLYANVSAINYGQFSSYELTPGTLISFVSVSVTVGGNIFLNDSPYVITSVTPTFIEFDAETTAVTTEISVGGTFLYRIKHPALSNAPAAFGWGLNVWSGNFGWSMPTEFTEASKIFGFWSMARWGTDILAVNRSPLIYWDASNFGKIDTPAVYVTAAPSIIDIVRVHVPSRIVCLYSTHDTSGYFDPFLVRWSDMESYTTWTPALTNTAGDYRLQGDGVGIVAVEPYGDDLIIFTDKEIFIQRYVGAPEIFGFQMLSNDCGAVSKNAVVNTKNTLYWMSINGFYKFDGRVIPIPCTLQRYIFEHLDKQHLYEVFAGSIERHNEIIWFFPCIDGVRRYVIYNTVENHWSIGTLDRTAWSDSGVFDYPLAGTYKDVLYHEYGWLANGQYMHSWLESSCISKGPGNEILFSNRIFPEFIKPDGKPYDGHLRLIMIYKKYPRITEVLKGPYIVSVSTKRIYYRMRGRDFRVYIESKESEVPWRLGTLRIGLQEDGTR